MLHHGLHLVLVQRSRVVHAHQNFSDAIMSPLHLVSHAMFSSFQRSSWLPHAAGHVPWALSMKFVNRLKSESCQEQVAIKQMKAADVATPADGLPLVKIHLRCA